jgi:hypothetical protein
VAPVKNLDHPTETKHWCRAPLAVFTIIPIGKLLGALESRFMPFCLRNWADAKVYKLLLGCAGQEKVPDRRLMQSRVRRIGEFGCAQQASSVLN